MRGARLDIERTRPSIGAFVTQLAELTVFPLRLQLKQGCHIAGKVGAVHRAGAPHIYVRLRTSDGAEGWGEARPSPRWSYETPETVVTTLRHYFAPALVGTDVGNVEELHRRMDGEIAPGPSTGQPIARSAVDMAAHD